MPGIEPKETDILVIAPQPVSTVYDDLAPMGEAADNLVSRGTLQEYHSMLTHNTLRRQRADLSVFASYLLDAGVLRAADDLLTDINAWEGMTYGIVKGYVKWQIRQGYAIGSVNVRLATVKTYCELATEATVIPPTKLALIKTVKGYSHKTGRNIDKERPVNRVGDKKAEPTLLNVGHALLLKQAVDETVQSKRDALLMCLLLDHGFRCGEIVALRTAHFNLETGQLTFYREKVDLKQTHALTPDTLIALMAYLAVSPSRDNPYLFAGYKGKAMSTRGLNKRVETLGTQRGIEGLSPHDCRHYWATQAMRSKTDIKALQTAGGWNSPAMPLRYAQAAEIANDGVKLS